MLLNKLLKAIQPVQVTGESDIEITGINIDSRLVEAGQLFMAMRGTQADGHAYIPTAIEKGAVAVLWRPDFQNGTGRRHGNKWKNDNCHLII